jgi:hypothetical protein
MVMGGSLHSGFFWFFSSCLPRFDASLMPAPMASPPSTAAAPAVVTVAPWPLLFAGRAKCVGGVTVFSVASE